MVISTLTIMLEKIDALTPEAMHSFFIFTLSLDLVALIDNRSTSCRPNMRRSAIDLIIT